MMIATRHGDTYVKKATNWRGRELFRSSSKEKMETAQAVCSDGPILTF